MASPTDQTGMSREEISQKFLLPERRVKVTQIMRSINMPLTDEIPTMCLCNKDHQHGFMIACDACNVWFHGTCVSVTPEEGETIKRFYCPVCQGRDDSLSTVHMTEEEQFEAQLEAQNRAIEMDHGQGDQGQESRKQKKFGKKSSRKCGDCDACNRTEDCRVCTNCKDMRKHGGPNRLHQKCKLKMCRQYLPATAGQAGSSAPAEAARKSASRDHQVSSRGKKRGKGRPRLHDYEEDLEDDEDEDDDDDDDDGAGAENCDGNDDDYEVDCTPRKSSKRMRKVRKGSVKDVRPSYFKDPTYIPRWFTLVFLYRWG